MKMCVSKWKVAWIVAFCLLLIVSIRPQVVTAEESDFEIKDGVLVNYHGMEENVVIPDYVTSIGDYAFQNCATIKQIAIPYSVTSIKARAFINCSGLTKVILPDSIKKIGDGAFLNCISLTEVTLPSNITSIPSSLFMNCTLLKTINLPTGVTSIGSFAFSCCSSLESIYLPDTLTSIGTEAFWKCGLANVTIPKSVKKFGAKILEGTPWLKDAQKSNPMVIVNNVLIDGSKCKGKVNIPKTVIGIAEEAFSETSITSVTMGDQVTTIGQLAFCDCKKLTSVLLSNSLERLEYNTFSCCEKLKRINMPKKLKYIGDFCFDTCTSLTGTITLPNALTTLGSGCFIDCSNISDFIFPKSLTELKEYPFQGTAWDEKQDGDFVIVNQILCRIGKYNIREHAGAIILPNTIKKIIPCAFQNCRMTSVVIPKSVVKIGNEAFGRDIFLERITIPVNTVLDGDVFKDCNEDLLIFSASNSKAKKYATQHNLRFEAIGFEYTEYSVASGKTLKLNLNCLANCSWQSSDTSIASVNAKGVVTAKTQGTVVITAKLYGRKYTCTVKVQ